MPEQAAAEKAKEAGAFTCKYKGCNGKYTDARGSGGGSKKNYGVCSSKCRAAAKKAPRKCQHGGHQKSKLQGLRHGLLRPRAPEDQVQGLRHGPLRARAREGAVQGLRHGLLQPRAPGGKKGLRHGPHWREYGRQKPEGAVQGLPLTGMSS
jgi:hypothetical protein